MKKNIIFLIFFLAIGFLIYMSVFNKKNDIIDTSHYQKTIDSLNMTITKSNLRIDSLNKSVENRNAKIAAFNIELAGLKNKLNKEKKAHEQDINRINAMSSSELSSSFANEFK
jgi:uncharacterized coiled-coil DUF342 family protein